MKRKMLGPTKFERCPVTRPNWFASGATNCTHRGSGAEVFLRGDYWIALPMKQRFRSRDEAMEAIEKFIGDCQREFLDRYRPATRSEP